MNLPIETSPIENTARLRAAHSWLSYFVGCITSTHLQQFIFYLRGTAEDIDAFIDIGDWEAFSHLLDTFPDLTSVAFFWSAEVWPELQKRCLDSEALVKLERLLPGLVKQGILELDYNAYSSRRMTELLSVKPDDVPWYGAKYRS